MIKGFGVSGTALPQGYDFYVVAQNSNLASNIQNVYDEGKPAIILALVDFNAVVPNMDLGKAISLGWLENPITKELEYSLRNKTYCAVMLRLFEGGWHKDGTTNWAGDYARATAKLITENLHVPVIIDCSAEFMKKYGGDALYQWLDKSLVCQRNTAGTVDVINWIPGTKLMTHIDRSVDYRSVLTLDALYTAINYKKTNVIPAVEPTKEVEMVLGIDVSTWQDSPTTPQHIDFNKAVVQGTRFVFVKASQATFTDSDFTVSWKLAKEAGLLRGAYHYLTWGYSGTKQAQYVWDLIKNDPGELPIAVDYEMANGATASSINVLKGFLSTMEALSGKKPIIYTGPSFWRSYGSKDLAYARYPLWIANYALDESKPLSKPDVPLPWTYWTFWQYSAKGDGKAYGMESGYVDLDRFNGTMPELLQFAGRDVPYQEPTEAEKLRRLWAAHPELH